MHVMSQYKDYMLYLSINVSSSFLSLQIPLYQRSPPDMKKVAANNLETFPRIPMASVLVRSFFVYYGVYSVLG